MEDGMKLFLSFFVPSAAVYPKCNGFCFCPFFYSVFYNRLQHASPEKDLDRKPGRVTGVL